MKLGKTVSSIELMNENKKENLKIAGLLYVIGVVSGLILEIII